MPSAPQICTARSTTRPTASATKTLDTEENCAAALEPVSNSHAVRQISARLASMSISESASICWTMPRSPSAEPNAIRLPARSSATSWARRAAPSQRMQCVSRAGP